MLALAKKMDKKIKLSKMTKKWHEGYAQDRKKWENLLLPSKKKKKK